MNNSVVRHFEQKFCELPDLILGEVGCGLCRMGRIVGVLNTFWGEIWGGRRYKFSVLFSFGNILVLSAPILGRYFLRVLAVRGILGRLRGLKCFRLRFWAVGRRMVRPERFEIRNVHNKFKFSGGYCKEIPARRSRFWLLRSTYTLHYSTITKEIFQ
jgi:hypothetical protein